MSKPIPDKAEVALEYPDKFYVGTFEHSSRFEAHLDGSGFALVLQRPGAEEDIAHREQLAEALAELQQALGKA